MNRLPYRGLFFILAGVCLPACQESRGPVIAQVGSETITQADLQSRLRETPAAYQHYVTTSEGRRQFVNLMIREKTILIAARRSGLQRDPAYQAALDQFKTQWKRRLKDYEESLLVESYIRKLRTQDLAVPDAEVQRYFDAHRTDYDKPLEIQVSHILLNTPAEAQTALDRLKAGEPFEKVAREMSKDPATAVHGGKLNPFQRGTLVPEFEEAAFALANGQISGIVKTQFGFHIIRKIGEKLLPSRSFAEVKEEIRARLERDKFDQWVTQRQSALAVKVNEQNLSTLSPTSPGNPQESPSL